MLSKVIQKEINPSIKLACYADGDMNATNPSPETWWEWECIAREKSVEKTV